MESEKNIAKLPITLSENELLERAGKVLDCLCQQEKLRCDKCNSIGVKKIEPIRLCGDIFAMCFCANCGALLKDFVISDVVAQYGYCGE